MATPIQKPCLQDFLKPRPKVLKLILSRPRARYRGTPPLGLSVSNTATNPMAEDVKNHRAKVSACVVKVTPRMAPRPPAATAATTLVAIKRGNQGVQRVKYHQRRSRVSS